MNKKEFFNTFDNESLKIINSLDERYTTNKTINDL